MVCTNLWWIYDWLLNTICSQNCIVYNDIGLQTFNSADALNIRQPALTVSNNKYGIADIGTWSETHNCSEYRLANALKIKVSK